MNWKKSNISAEHQPLCTVHTLLDSCFCYFQILISQLNRRNALRRTCVICDQTGEFSHMLFLRQSVSVDRSEMNIFCWRSGIRFLASQSILCSSSAHSKVRSLQGIAVVWKLKFNITFFVCIHFTWSRLPVTTVRQLHRIAHFPIEPRWQIYSLPALSLHLHAVSYLNGREKWSNGRRKPQKDAHLMRWPLFSLSLYSNRVDYRPQNHWSFHPNATANCGRGHLGSHNALRKNQNSIFIRRRRIKWIEFKINI